jgi:hypothetical protein
MKMLLAMIALLLAGPVYANDDKAHTDVKRIGVPAPADAPGTWKLLSRSMSLAPPRLKFL